MVEQTAQTLDNGEAEAQAAVATRQPVEFAEDIPSLVLRNSRTAIPDFDADLLAAVPTSDHHAARGRVTHRIGHQVQDDPFEQDRIAADPGAARYHAERQSLF